MSIKPSASSEINTLIAALGSGDEVRRESAIARLAVIGARSVDRLVATYATATRDTRIAILRTLEGVGDARALPIAREALRAGGDLALAAASSLRPFLGSTDSRAATDALDALLSIALDTAAERRVRMAAYEALAEMPDDVRGPVAEALQRDMGIEPARERFPLTEATWQDARGGRLPDNPAALREALDAYGATAPLSTLQTLVDAVRARESQASAETEREDWQQLRGAIHQALALRGSRIAVYDLRETVAAASSPLPATFLAALQVVGDESCLEPIAAAWTASTDGDAGAGWRHQLQSAFAAIVKRDKISRNGAVLKRIQTKFPEAASELNTPSRTTPRRSTRRRT